MTDTLDPFKKYALDALNAEAAKQGYAFTFEQGGHYLCTKAAPTARLLPSWASKAPPSLDMPPTLLEFSLTTTSTPGATRPIPLANWHFRSVGETVGFFAAFLIPYTDQVAYVLKTQGTL